MVSNLRIIWKQTVVEEKAALVPTSSRYSLRAAVQDAIVQDAVVHPPHGEQIAVLREQLEEQQAQLAEQEAELRVRVQLNGHL